MASLSAIRGRVATLAPVLARGMATEKQILQRIVSTTNVGKITSSMKMVSAAKMKGDEKRLKDGKPFSDFTTSLGATMTSANDIEDTVPGAADSNLVIAITSDRGLCGGCNSFVIKATNKVIANLQREGKEVGLFVIGEKGKVLARRCADISVGSVSDSWKIPSNFTQTSAIATEILASGEYDAAHIVHNKFVSVIAYDTSVRSFAKFSGTEDSPALAPYEFENNNDEELESLYEFCFTAALHGSILEAATSEMSARMQAMENASKNAREMVEKLQRVYNRARQARITTELIEIISGASALED